jgi:RNA polymerase sigma-70 factor, ECF subfamily
MTDSTEPTDMDGDQASPRVGEAGGDASSAPRDIVGVVRAYHQQVYRYAYHLAGNAADAEDLAQQTFLIAHQKLYQIREWSKLDRWLFAVLRSCFRRQCRRRIPTPVASLELEMEDVPVPSPAVDAIDREQLGWALQQLPGPSRVILMMFYFDAYSYKEIAEQLEVPIGTVMSRLARAKDRLRALLTESRAASHSPHGRA